MISLILFRIAFQIKPMEALIFLNVYFLYSFQISHIMNIGMSFHALLKIGLVKGESHYNWSGHDIIFYFVNLLKENNNVILDRSK